jgi:hypothetical protein
MENSLDSNFENASGLKITQQAKSFILETAKWAKFLAIVGFVFIGLMVIGAFFMLIAGAALPGMGGAGAGVGILYLLMALLYFFPTYYLLIFANKIKVGISQSIQNDVDTGFENLKSMFKFMGILMIVVLGIYALFIVIALIAGLSAAM